MVPYSFWSRSHAPRIGFALLAAVATTGLALAQETKEEIIVTGSRVSQSGFDSAQPLSVIDQTQIENLGIVNVGEVLRQLPQNTAFFTETNVGIGNFNVGAQLANLRGLNPFFGTRTLTLVDTKRVVPNSEGGAIDLTLIPSMLVERTEVVTGGASAAYGSDAIAGVVNVILNKKLEGVKIQADFGQTFEGDGNDKHVSFGWGTGFAKDRGHVMVGAEFQNQDRIGPCSRNRDWCQQGWVNVTNPGFATNGLPNFIIAPGGKFPTTENGVITPCLTAGCAVGAGQGAPQQFNAAGTALQAYTPPTYGGLFGGIGNSGDIRAYDLSSIRPETKRNSIYGHMSFDISDTLEFFAEVGHAHSDASGDPANGALGPLGARIQGDNAYLLASPALAAALPNGGLLARVFMPNLFSADNTTENDTTRIVTGLNGKLGQKWTWDAYYQHGTNENHQRLNHNVVGSLTGAPSVYNFVGWAMDAVHSVPGDLSSPIVCRATLPGPAFSPLAAGCVPLDLIGADRPSQAAIDYSYRTLPEDADYTQNVVGANFRTELAKGWAGPIQGAFGAEIRHDQSTVTHQLASQPWAGSYFLTYGGDRGGEMDVTEAYGEVQIPFSKKFHSDFSVRQTTNDAQSMVAGSDTKSHSFSSWKASAIYDPLEWLRVRATRSEDVRAAGFRELFYPRLTLLGAPGSFPAGVNNPWNGNVAEAYNTTSGGNADLKPETADTTTLGLVFSFDKFRFSVDWYEINLKDAITAGGTGGLSGQQVVDACFRGGQAACARVVGAGTTDIISVDSSSVNIGSYIARGYDLEMGYNRSLKDGSLNLRVIASNLYNMTIDSGLGNPAINFHGQTGPVASFGGFNTSPDWQASTFLTWTRKRFTTTFEARYIGAGKLNVLYSQFAFGTNGAGNLNTVSNNTVPSRIYLTWAGSYDFNKSTDGKRSTQLFWSVNNLFDKDPPVAPGGNLYPTNPVFFDTIGARVRAGVRLNF
jgi:outer membrane receptor protein involved in Fe transport